MRDPPAEPTREDVLAMAPAGEHLLFTTSELFWLPSAGVLDSDLDLTAVERALGVVTGRTKNTVERIQARYLAG